MPKHAIGSILLVYSYLLEPSFAFAKDGIYPLAGLPFVGILTESSLSGKPTNFYLHQYLFRFEREKWSGAIITPTHGSAQGPAEDHYPSYTLPFASSVKIYFDGKVLGAVSIAPESCSPISKKVPASIKTLLKKQDGVLTTTFARPSDPDQWKPIALEKASFTEEAVQLAWKNSELCKVQNSGNMREGNRPALKIKKIYSVKDKSRFLVTASKVGQCMREGGADDMSKMVWLFRDASSKWHLREGNKLVDIGDFNGDGKTEGLFQGEHWPPETSFDLIDMQTFRLHVSVGVSEGVTWGPDNTKLLPECAFK